MRRLPSGVGVALLLLPALLVVVLGLFAPVGSVVKEAFFPSHAIGPAKSALSAARDFFRHGGDVILLRTVEIATLTAVVTLLLAYPVAYFLYTRQKQRIVRTLVVFALLSPLFVSVVARSFAWTLILVPRTGVLSYVPLLRDQRLLFTKTAVVIGLANVFMPLMVISIYASLSQVPTNALRAAQSLGARLPRITLTTLIPLSMQGIVSGVTLVFVLASASVTVPVMLGGPGARTMGYEIWQDYSYFFDYVSGGVLMLLLVLVSLAVACLLFAFARLFRVPVPGTVGQ